LPFFLSTCYRDRLRYVLDCRRWGEERRRSNGRICRDGRARNRSEGMNGHRCRDDDNLRGGGSWSRTRWGRDDLVDRFVRSFDGLLTLVLVLVLVLLPASSTCRSRSGYGLFTSLSVGFTLSRRSGDSNDRRGFLADEVFSHGSFVNGAVCVYRAFVMLVMVVVVVLVVVVNGVPGPGIIVVLNS